jgi:hypothetical protein
MTVPYRRFSRLHLATLKGDAPTGDFSNPLSWTTDHEEAAYNYFYVYSNVTNHRARWDFAMRGYVEDGWEEIVGLDKIAFVKIRTYIEAPFLNSVPVTTVRFAHGALNDPAALGAAYQWDPDAACGRYWKDADQWDGYPMQHFGSASWSISLSDIDVADMPLQKDFYFQSWNNLGGTSPTLDHRQQIFEKGFSFRSDTYTPSTAVWASNKGFGVNINIQSVEIHYFNPITNALSRHAGPAAGGFPLVLTGMGYRLTDAEIGEGCVPPLNPWGDRVDYIFVEDIYGNVVATLQHDLETPPFTVHEFKVDSNTQLTIHAFPALPAGLYCLRLRKVLPAPYAAENPEGYAGDWRANASGIVRAGDRLWICLGDECGPGKKPLILSRWKWKKGDQYVFRYYAPIDVRSQLVFYDGLILSISSFTRGTDDSTGLPLFADMEIELDNTSLEFSKLLAEYWVKNQEVEIFAAWEEEPEVFKTAVFRGIVSDYDQPHSRWRVTLRDVLEKYFSTKVPRYTSTVAEYPNIHPNCVGWEMPEVLGRAVLDSGSSPGAIEAVYVNTATHKYLAARGSLHAILNVYADGTLIAPAQYDVTYEDGGRTYITFHSDKGDARITFDAEGYSYADWDSANGYVQNPIYIVLFALAFFAEIPDANVDVGSFDDLAARYMALGFAESGYLILQDETDISTVLQDLLWTYGAKLWPSLDGKITIGRKDLLDITPVVLLYDQIDALAEPVKSQGFDEAVNYAPIKWRFYPTANYYAESKIALRQSSIDAFEATIMPKGGDWMFPWTMSEALVDLRAGEELLKLGFGEQRLTLEVSTEHMMELDILENFAFQDPYALHAFGLGAVAKLYYADRLTYDVLGGRLTIEAVDLQWLLRQYFVLGDEDIQASNWSAATEPDRMYGYLCDEVTGKFVDGEPGKILIDENIGG